ncbi:hypothetical protein [Planktothrix agardhii]|uniref:hypothetical protein n=1 Tax=Planktothrix agardhii TaxID=1160 RepID=UPI001D09F841|nr:hypothetical protein [Planktothrix agardhii]MCB8750227.1 hypothetical protein [Planktothrix agardhii 1810]
MDSTQSKLSRFPKTLKIGKPPFKISLTWAFGILILLWTPLIFFQTWSIQHSDKPFITVDSPEPKKPGPIIIIPQPPIPVGSGDHDPPVTPPPPPDIDLSKMGVLIGVGSVVTVGAIAAGAAVAPAVILGGAVTAVFYLWSSHQ